MKVWCLKYFICTDSSDKQSAFDRLQNLPKAELSSVQKIAFITAITDKKIISVFCVSGGNVPPHTHTLQSAVQIKYIFPSARLSFLLAFATQEKKANQLYFYINYI